MNHVTADLAAYRAGELPPHSETRVKEHLASCAACREEFEAMTNLWELLGKAAQPEDSAHSVWPEVRARTVRDTARAWPALGWGMAALVAGVLVGVTLPGSAPVSGQGTVALTASGDNTWLESSWLENEQSSDLATGWFFIGDETNEDGS